MEFKNAVENEGFYRFDFEDAMENKLIKLTIEFYEKWSLTQKRKNTLEDFGEVIGFYIPAATNKFPFDIKDSLRTVPLHIPNGTGRHLFKTCFEFFINQTNAPVHVSLTEHPGYPLILVTYDCTIITKEDTVNRWINNIMNGIQSCEVITEELEKDASVEGDDIDEIDEDVIVEYELDDELLKAMKEPAEQVFLPLEGEGEE